MSDLSPYEEGLAVDLARAQDRIEELKGELSYWKADSAAAWDKCEERRLENARLREALDIDFIEQAISDVLSEGGTYRDAAEYVARAALAELKGEK